LDAVVAPVLRPNGDVETLVGLASADMRAVDALIVERMQSPVSVIPALADHLIAAGGKRLRPLITLAAARLAGIEGDIHHKLAASVEFIHTATLLHDDVVDGSQMRRGKVAETGSLRALKILSRASSVIAEGEVLQLTRAHDLKLGQDVYLEIITAKTAELFAAAAESGAVAAGATEAGTAALRSYGLNLGLAFQLVDDALDYGGQSEVLGKNAGDDFREGKATLPLLLAIARTAGREDAFWERTVGRREQTEADFKRARELIVGTGALQATLDLAGDYADTAKDALGDFPESAWRDALERLADFAVSRPA
jgi:octaprenyl-diphosphate synthase